MKKIQIQITCFLFTICLYSCTKDEVDALSDIVIENFSNQWSVVKGPQPGLYFFNSTVTDSAKAIGTLEGNLNQPSPSSTVLDITGTFENRNVSITILHDTQDPDPNPKADSTYSGKFDDVANPHLLRLKNTVAPFDSLVLKQGS